MAKVSISEAARLAGITRQYFYKKYINTGTVSVETDNAGVKGIDTAELFRVFGELQGDSKKETQILQVTPPENDSKIAVLEAELRLTRELLKAREDHIADLQQSLRLLEHRPAVDPLAKLTKEVNILKKESLWRRIMGSKGAEAGS